MLRGLPGPIGIISVAGMYRTGKSYLLNRMLLNRSGGFGVGPTINPCTKVSQPPHPVSSCAVIFGSLTALGECGRLTIKILIIKSNKD
jgi:hypothetical protein